MYHGMPNDLHLTENGGCYEKYNSYGDCQWPLKKTDQKQKTESKLNKTNGFKEKIKIEPHGNFWMFLDKEKRPIRINEFFQSNPTKGETYGGI